jgi:tetratricopeptide (TPR) repeat protein
MTQRFFSFLAILMLTCVLISSAQQRKHSRVSKPGEGVPTLPGPQIDAIRQNNIGIALMERQRFEDALGKFQTACVMDPDSEVGCMNMGVALLYMQHYDDARRVLTKSTSRQPQNPVPWFNLGLLDKTVGQDATALKEFERAASIDPNDPDIQYFLGTLYAADKQYPKAIAAYKKAVQLNPLHASAELGLAEVAQQTNDTDAALAHLNRFRHITSDNLGEPVSTSYGQQGEYSRAQRLPWAPEPPGAPSGSRFSDVTAASGLEWPASVAGKPRKKQDDLRDSDVPAHSLANFLGSGACVFDYNGDGKPDVFLVNFDGKGNAALFKNLGEGRFVNETKAAKLEFRGEGTGCAFGDYDNDGKPDLVIGSSAGIRLYHNEGNGTFQDVTDAAGVACDGLVLGVTFLDYDNDGDLDLYVARFTDFRLSNSSQPFTFPLNAEGPGNIIWRNKGNGTFMNWTKQLGLAATGPSSGALAVDLKNDRVPDLVLSGWRKAPVAMINTRDGPFQSTSPWTSEFPGAAAGIVPLDFDKDGWIDLAFTSWAQPGISLWRNALGKTFQRVDLPDPGWMRGWGLAALDYDDDGWIDLAAVGETFSGEGRILLLRNEGLKGFRDVTQETGLDKVVLHAPRSVIAFDSNGDGSADLLITQNNQPPVLLKNVGGNKNGWIELAFKGESAAKSGSGASVTVFAGGQRQYWQVTEASGYLSQGPTEILAGMGSLGQADVVRVVWPSGTLQNELQVPGLKRTVISEFDPRDATK